MESQRRPGFAKCRDKHEVLQYRLRIRSICYNQRWSAAALRGRDAICSRGEQAFGDESAAVAIVVRVWSFWLRKRCYSHCCPTTSSSFGKRCSAPPPCLEGELSTTKILAYVAVVLDLSDMRSRALSLRNPRHWLEIVSAYRAFLSFGHVSFLSRR